MDGSFTHEVFRSRFISVKAVTNNYQMNLRYELARQRNDQNLEWMVSEYLFFISEVTLTGLMAIYPERIL